MLCKRLFVNLRTIHNRVLFNYRNYCAQMGKSAIVLLSEGAEEMEAVITVDVLRRAEIEVVLAGLEGKGCVKCSRGVKICPDADFADLKSCTYDIVIMPGGLKGASNLSESDAVKQFLSKHQDEGKVIAAICAAPIALQKHGIGEGKTVTSYPSVKDKVLTGKTSYKYSEDKVVIDDKLITSRGPGTAFDFGLAIVEYLEGKEKRNKVAAGLLLQ